MTADTFVLHILPNGRMVLSTPALADDEMAMVIDIVRAWRLSETEVLVLNRPVEIVVHERAVAP